MEEQRNDYLKSYDEERRPIPRWMVIYVLVIVGGLALAYLAYQWSLT